MELHHLRYFVALAAEHHFTRAAKRVGISQQALSVAIRQVEEEVGAELVQRTTRRVQLTRAGERFARDAERTLAQLRDAIAGARAVAHEGRLRIVYPGPFGDLPHAGVGLFQRRHPTIVTTLSLLPSHEQERAVREGEADVGFVVPPPRDGALAYRAVLDDALLAALPRRHRLARRRRLRLSDLAGEPFVLYSARFKLAMVRFVRDACASAGFTPDVRHDAQNEEALLGLVAEGLGVGLVSSQHASRALPRVALRPVVDAPRLGLGAVFRPSAAEHLACFFRALDDTVRASRGSAKPAAVCPLRCARC